MALRRRFVMLIICTAAVSLAYRYITSRKKKPTPPQNQINEVLTFAEAIPPQCEHSRPVLHPSTQRILYYLNLARFNVDICMEMITCLDITCQLVDLHRRGVKIRLIVDADMAYVLASGVKLLQNQGVDARMASVDTMFRNFCLVDTKIEDSNVVPFIIFGSPPWSKEALAGDNNEIVFVTSKPVFLNVFKEEFERLYLGAI